MAAAMLVALAAALEIIVWRTTGAVRALTVAATLVAATLLALLVADVTGWTFVALALSAACWALARWFPGAGWGPDVAVVVLGVVAVGLVLATDSGQGGAAVVAGAGVAVFLTHPANEACRALLARVRADDASREPSEDEPAPASGLKGGRIIGPLERWLITGLALVGAQAIIVGLMAAKGLGRFPEISSDRGSGSKAEEFLVGSLVSWTIAAGGAALIAAV